MSIHFEITRTIQRPIETVFDRLADIANYAQWLPRAGIFISTSQDSEGATSLGAQYTDRTTMGTFRGEIIEFQRPAKIVFQHRLHWLGIPVMETRPGYLLEPLNGSTKVQHSAEGQLFGVFKLLRARASRIARAERARTVEALKASLEAPRD